MNLVGLGTYPEHAKNELLDSIVGELYEIHKTCEGADYYVDKNCIQSDLEGRDLEAFNTICRRLIVLFGRSALSNLNNLDDDKLQEIVKTIPRALKLIKNPGRNVVLAAVKPGRTMDIDTIFINSLKDDLKLEIIETAPEYFELIGNPTDEMKLTAVKKDGGLIAHIENPSDEMKIEAIRSSIFAISCINELPDGLPWSSEIITALAEDPTTILSIDDPEEELAVLALRGAWGEDVLAILNGIEHPSNKIKLEVVRSNGFAIQYIDNPTEEMKIEAVKSNGRAIQYIDNPTEEMQQKAAKQQGVGVLQYIHTPSEITRAEAIFSTLDSSSYDGLLDRCSASEIKELLTRNVEQKYVFKQISHGIINKKFTILNDEIIDQLVNNILGSSPMDNNTDQEVDESFSLNSYTVRFKYYSNFEEEDDDYLVFIEETFSAESLDDVYHEIENDEDFDDSPGINFDAKSELIEAGREIVWVKDSKGSVLAGKE